MSTLAQRYAKAVLDTAPDSGRADALVSQLTTLVPHLSEHAPLYGRLMQVGPSEALPQDVTQLFKTLGLDPAVVGLIRVMLRNRRLEHFAHVATAAGQMADARASRCRADVISAIALSDSQHQRLELTLSKRMGLKVVAHITVDPTLGAGLVCHVGRVTIDSSLSSQLRRLAQQSL